MTREELIKKAQELAESEELTNVSTQIANLKKQWRRAGSFEEESLYDIEMGEQFDKYLDQISARENEVLASCEEKKNEIIAKAKEVLNMKNFKQATNEMNALMDEWKKSGSVGKEKDDELWAQFKEARSQFFANRKAYYEELNAKYDTNKAAKEELIAKAKEIGAMENMKEATAQMNALMEEWKKTGTAGRNTDEALWKEFSGERQAFFKHRNEYYANLKETYAKKVEAKKELIQKAKKCLAFSEFTEEEVSTMKGIRAQWKEIGYAGKDNEEALWTEFNEVVNKYYDNMKYYG